MVSRKSLWRSGILFVAIAGLAGWSPKAGAEGLARDKLETIKRATVFIKAKFHPNDVTGSGFLFQRDANDGYVATNAHVVGLHGADPKIEVVFHSGSVDERTVAGQVIARDEPGDLAIVKVSLENLPDPLSIETEVEGYETMPVVMLGFPFGSALARTRRNPEITVSEGRVSSLRKDKHNLLSAVQIDSSINPGNSGGPVVNHQGELIGIAVAKVRGTQIGFVIPVAELRDLLSGRLSVVKVEQVEAINGKAAFKVLAEIADPRRQVKEVTL